ncbi:hypothetical protein DOTSEDRAFT_45362 [Dothistroma septosporum NZE10]|uniref:Uncharacterized protein n=1 Tax=Dothistroma septosporum (strain NZE10 / CBS 128990) TaxID=675120 RepID=M2Y5C1_DOTSN|nr:hypothetical protein DOTSEDRAFT_45362 [Dothistroma septosporum NZE10]
MYSAERPRVRWCGVRDCSSICSQSVSEESRMCLAHMRGRSTDLLCMHVKSLTAGSWGCLQWEISVLLPYGATALILARMYAMVIQAKTHVDNSMCVLTR